MGHGDEGLARALAWGKRTVKGKVSKSVAVSKDAVSIELASVSKAAPANAVAAPVKSVEERVWTEPVGVNSSKEMIRALSQKLSEIGYLPSGVRESFDAEMKFALIRFQNDQSLLKSAKDTNAGYYGPATRKALKAAYAEKKAESEEVALELGTLSSDLSAKIASVSKEMETLRLALESVGTPKDGETGSHVRVLQEALVSLGYLDAKPTGIYGPKTRDAVAAFQIRNGLVLSKDDPNAGKF